MWLKVKASKKGAHLDQSSAGKRRQCFLNARVPAGCWGDSQAKKERLEYAADVSVEGSWDISYVPPKREHALILAGAKQLRKLFRLCAWITSHLYAISLKKQYSGIVIPKTLYESLFRIRIFGCSPTVLVLWCCMLQEWKQMFSYQNCCRFGLVQTVFLHWVLTSVLPLSSTTNNEVKGDFPAPAHAHWYCGCHAVLEPNDMADLMYEDEAIDL